MEEKLLKQAVGVHIQRNRTMLCLQEFVITDKEINKEKTERSKARGNERKMEIKNK
jgi:hypothetical protein